MICRKSVSILTICVMLSTPMSAQETQTQEQGEQGMSDIAVVGSLLAGLLGVAAVFDVVYGVVLPNSQGKRCDFCHAKKPFTISALAYHHVCDAGHAIVAHGSCLLDRWANENTGSLTCPESGCKALLDYPQ